MFAFLPRDQVDHAERDTEDELDGSRVRCEERRVLLWRYWQARQCGVEPRDARRFAASGGDLETLRALVGVRGCPPRTAVEILA